MGNAAESSTEWVTKQEAADLLGVSLKSVQKYVAQGKLTAKYVKGRTGDAMFIPRAEVENLKSAHQQVTFKPSTQTLPVPVSPIPPAALVPETVTEALGRFLTMAVMPNKLLLTIEEAAAVSGLPKSYLRTAIAEERLPAVNVSRRWLVKRAELEEFVEGL